MSWSAHIHITFYKVGSVSETLEVLRKAGWGFYDGRIFYDFYPNPDDPLFSEKQAPEASWPEVLRTLEAKSEEGEIVTLDFYWQSNGPHITCLMRSRTDLLILADASPPRLEGSRHLTDFSWLLARLAVPLIDAGFDIEEVECNDSH